MTLTPTEIIRLGLEQGHSPDVILASLEAGGWAVVPMKPTHEMQQEGEAQRNQWNANATAIYCAFLAARPKNLVQARPELSEPSVPSPGDRR